MTPRLLRTRLFLIRFSNSRLSQRSAARILCSAPGKPHSHLLPRRPNENRGRAGRQGSATDPRASMPRDIEACRPPSRLRRFGGLCIPQVRQSQGVPRAVFGRFAPQRPRWTEPFRQPPLSLRIARPPIHRSWAQMVPSTSGRAGCHRQWGRRGARSVRRDGCGLDRRAMAPHLRCHLIPRPPLPAPRLKMLIRHPSVTRRDAHKISALWRAGISFFSCRVFSMCCEC
jgi:hypothetical protein